MEHIIVLEKKVTSKETLSCVSFFRGVRTLPYGKVVVYFVVRNGVDMEKSYDNSEEYGMAREKQYEKIIRRQYVS